MTRLTAKVMGDEFAPVLGELVPHLVTVINQEEGQFENAEEEQVSRALVGRFPHVFCTLLHFGGAISTLCIISLQDGQFNALDDSDDEDAEARGGLLMYIRTAILET